jgi:hypothetical protein
MGNLIVCVLAMSHKFVKKKCILGLKLYILSLTLFYSARKVLGNRIGFYKELSAIETIEINDKEMFCFFPSLVNK